VTTHWSQMPSRLKYGDLALFSSEAARGAAKEGEDAMIDGGSDKTDAEELKEILSVVSTEIPKLVEGITKMMYDNEHAEKMAKSVAQFYKELVAAGMKPEMAYDLTSKYMANMSMGGIISQAMGHADKSEIGDAIKQKIKKEIENDD
jgi:hypothetical protein